MKKILVTGSNGFLGQKITECWLERRDFELIASGIGANRYPFREGYRYLDLDVTDAGALSLAFETYRPDAVINTAALALPDQCEKEPERCDLLNRQVPGMLADLCASFGAHLVHLSTDFIFDGENGPYRETDEPRPLSLYGASKLAGEVAVAASAASYAIVRTVLVYGVIPGSGRSNIVLWVKNALGEGRPIRVVADQWRTPTLVEDLAEACITAALSGANGIYHVSGDEHLSVYELACRVARHWNLDAGLISPVETAALNEPARRPLKTGFVIEKARRELGFQPRSLEEGLHLIDAQLGSPAGGA